MIDRQSKLSLVRQAQPLGMSRESIYYLPKPVSERDLFIMKRLDKLHLQHNVFVERFERFERFWLSVKYERVYLHAYDSVSQARASIMDYFDWYNHKRRHSNLNRQTSHQAYIALLPMIKKAA